MGAILAMEANRHLLDVPDIIERAERAARLMATNGFAAVRTHADTTQEHGLRSIEALLEVKRRVSDVIDVQVVSLCGWPMSGAAGATNRALLRDALEAGADLVGGCPHLEGEASRWATDFFLELAVEFGVPIDLHTDETLDRTAGGLSELAQGVLAGFPHAATASHCVSLGQLPLDEQRAIAELVAEAGVNVIALPQTNLFLQGRGTAPMPRGLTGVAALRAAGVNVAAGADNLQDPFNPVGRACPFETAGLMIMSAHDLPAIAWSTVTDAARTDARPACGRGRRGRPGGPHGGPRGHRARGDRQRSCGRVRSGDAASGSTNRIDRGCDWQEPHRCGTGTPVPAVESTGPCLQRRSNLAGSPAFR